MDSFGNLLAAWKGGKFINSSIQSWLYAGKLEKPEELLMYSPRVEGGLVVHHVRFKSLAILIKSFLETAIRPHFICNQFRNALYMWHVLGDSSINDPGFTPYYSAEFFNTIKQVVQEGLLNVACLSTKQWYMVSL